jgi:hypothetical protein
MKIPRISLLALLALAFVLAACTKQETAPSPTPTPTPHPTISGKGNPDCKAGGQGNSDCEVTTQQIANETGPAHHCGTGFDPATAIIIANQQAVNPGNGRWKGIHLKGTTPTETFDVTITGCDPGLPAAPFANMPNPGMHEWASGAVAAGVPYGAKYEMTVTIVTQKKGGGGTKSKGFDPHIVFGG